MLLQFLVFGLFSVIVAGSPGDNLDEFIDCTYACEYQRNCPYTEANYNDVEYNAYSHIKFSQTPVVLSTFLFWDCIADCDYQCQQIITQERMEYGEEILQFHGKWPFLRLLTMQELFSTLFSIGNFVPHFYGFQKLKAKIQASKNDAKTQILTNYLHVAIAGMFAWTASSIFHWRDLIITEKMDYFFAGMTVLTGFRAIFARMTRLYQFPQLNHLFTGSVIFIFFLHLLRLYIDWSYTYNMRFNIFFGILQYGLLIMLSIQNYRYLQSNKVNAKKSAYLSQSKLFIKLCLVPVLLVVSTSMAMSLELFDFFSYEFQIDAHAIWHLCTIWPSWVLYEFFLSDYDLIISDRR